MMVEACILLPIFLFAVMAMAGAFRFLELEESILYCGFQQMQKSGVQMAMEPDLAQVEQLFLEHKIVQEVSEELDGEMLRRCSIRGSGSAEVILGFLGEERKKDISCEIQCGWTVGTGRGGGAFSDRLRFCAREYFGEDQKSVWIFPNWGKRYHRSDCRVTGGERRRTVEAAARQQGYTPCLICLGGEDNGSD